MFKSLKALIAGKTVSTEIEADTISQKPRKSGEMFGDPKSPDRNLSPEESFNLKAGSNNYRTYVGPPNRFDFMAGTQFSLLFHLGLRDTHKVLDFGCGSLRLGRLLIPYLQRDNYFGIDPNDWLITDGLEREIGKDIQKIKGPRFSHNTDFNCDVFDEKFDFIIAQSIITHTGIDLFDKFLETAKKALKPNGLILFTYLPTLEPNQPLPIDGWHYPECVRYDLAKVDEIVNNAGLVGKALPWYHSVTIWYAVAMHEDELPANDKMHHLTGAVLRSEQFKESHEV